MLLQIMAALLQIATMCYYKLRQLLVLLQITATHYYKLRHVKSFGGSAKNRYFSRLYNDWTNIFININKKNCFLIFFKMFLKHVKMG